MGNKFLTDNLLWQPGVSVSSSSGDASGLLGKSLFPGYRSADRALVLNGSDEYATSASDDFDFVTKFVAEVDSIRLGSSEDEQTFCRRYDSSSGFELRASATGIPKMVLNGTITLKATGAVADGITKWYYDGPSQTAAIWVNGVEVVRAEGANIYGSGTLTGGEIPLSLPANEGILNVGAAISGVRYLNANLSLLALSDGDGLSNDNSHLDPAACAGYWNFQNDDLTDSSGNGNDLEESEIEASNYTDYTAWQWVKFVFPGGWPAANTLILDRRHNLSDGATVKIYYDASGAGMVSIGSATVVAGEPVAIATNNSIGSSIWWLEINDPENPDGYVSIPQVYMVDNNGIHGISRSYLSGYTSSKVTFAKVNESSNGVMTSYVNASSLYSIEPRWRVGEADFTALEKVVDYASDSSPIIFNPGDNNYYSVYIRNAADPQYKHIKGNRYFVDLDIREIG